MTTKPDYLGHRKRVKEKFLSSLGKELHDYELLEILLFTAFPRHDTKPIAKRLLAKFGSLSAVINADLNMLRECENVGDSAATSIKIIAEILNRVLKEKAREKIVLNNWQAVLDYAKSSLADLNHEVFKVIFLNKNFEIIDSELLASGGSDHVHIDTKTIAKKSLLMHASSIILIHNHPTSNLRASSFDIKTTNEIISTLKPLNIEVLDHLIVGKTGVFSFKENGIL